MYKTSEIQINIKSNEFIKENKIKDLIIGENNNDILTISSKLDIPGGNIGDILIKQEDGSVQLNKTSNVKIYNNLTELQSDINNVNALTMGLVNSNYTLYIKVNNSWHKVALAINTVPTWSSPAFNTTFPPDAGNSGDIFNLNQTGTEMEITLNATDPDLSALTYTVTSISPINPGSLQQIYNGNYYEINNNIIKVTPSTSVDDIGTVQFNVSVFDGLTTITSNFILLLLFQPPTWSSPVFNVTYPTATGNSGDTFAQNTSGTEMEITLNATDPDTTTLIYAVTSISPVDPLSLQPVYTDGDKYDITGNVIKVTPSTSVAGDVQFNVSASDGGNIITANFTLSLSFILYSMASPFTFTNCSAVGWLGPSLTQCKNVYPSWADSTFNFNVTSTGIQLWTVPKTGTYTIQAFGASAYELSSGGRGAIIGGNFSLSIGEVIRILVGQRPDTGTNTANHCGAGGTFVVKNANNNTSSILVIAGGGGGAHNMTHSSFYEANCHGRSQTSGGMGTGSTAGGTNGGGGTSPTAVGGSGFSGAAPESTPYGNVTEPGDSFIDGGKGGEGYGNYQAGFGGGGGHGNTHGGGGGGYSGGGGSTASPYEGGGGGSYNNGSSQTTSVGSSGGHLGQGKVIVTFIS